MTPLFAKPNEIKMENVGVRLEQLGITAIQSEALLNAAYAVRDGEVCLYTGRKGLLRFDVERMKNLGQELIDIAEMLEE